MRRQLPGLLIALVLAIPAFAQRSTAPPASLLTGGTHMSPGAATILSPSFGQVENGTRQHPGNHNGGTPLRGTVPPRRDHRNRHNNNVVPYYGGYYYPYYGYGYSLPVYMEDRSSLPGAGTFDTGTSEQEQPDDRVAPTVFENRRPGEMYYRPQAGAGSVLDESRYGEHYTDEREAARNSAQPNNGVVTANGNEGNDITTILIFKNGMQRDVTNYAIMGQYVYVFVGDRRKIPLSEIDVDATVKANEERGGQFKVPATSNPS